MHKKLQFMLGLLFILGLLVPIAVDARRHYRGYVGMNTDSTWSNPWKYKARDRNASSTTPTTPVQVDPIVSDPVAVPDLSSPVVISPSSPAEITFSAYVTGYSYWDNTPPGSAEISNPVIHQKAGGTGTYSDPITLAVGHSIINGKDILDYPEGTKFYLPYLQKYVIVEDTCGDGNTPQNGPCHTGYKGNPWIDLWVDGENVSRSISDNCMNDITDVHTAIENPGSNYPVTTGSISQTGCKQY